MNTFECDRLRAIGWSETLALRARAAAAAHGGADLAPMRITVVHRGGLELSDGSATHAGRALPRLLRGGGDALAVGDWVLVAADEAGDLWARERVAPTTRIGRRDGDGSVHAIVSNVDRALVVMGLDDDFNLRRLERYLALVTASGVRPSGRADQGRPRGAPTPARRDALLRAAAPCVCPPTSRSSQSMRPPRRAPRCSRMSIASARRSSCSARRAQASRR